MATKYALHRLLGGKDSDIVSLYEKITMFTALPGYSLKLFSMEEFRNKMDNKQSMEVVLTHILWSLWQLG